jgi:hypothetical protein
MIIVKKKIHDFALCPLLFFFIFATHSTWTLKFALRKNETVRVNLCENTTMKQWMSSTHKQKKIISEKYHE